MALICHCEGVRDRTIVKAIHRGASTLADVQAACGAATRCGGCEPAVHDLLERHAHGGVHAGADVGVRVRPAFGLSA
jgi:bacterioferritin-associated ferredoxin